MPILFMFSGGTFIRDTEVPDGWIWLKSMSPFEHASDAYLAAVWDPIEYNCPAEYIVPKDAIRGDIDLMASFENKTITKYLSSLEYGEGFFDNVSYVCSFVLGIFPCDVEQPCDSYPCADGETGFNKTWVADVSLEEGGSWTGGSTSCKVGGITAMTIYKNQNVDKWESLGWLVLFGCLVRLTTLFLKVVPPSKIMHSIKALFSSPDLVSIRKTAVHRAGHHDNVAGVGFSSKADLVMENITVTLKKKDKEGVKKVLVKSMFATCQGGKITALMGPSGAGKTTLLNAISGMAPYATVGGSVSLGGGALSKDLLSYVPQFDHLVEEFTVLETLMYSVLLKLNLAKEQVEGEVRALADLLGFASTLNVRIKDIAEGQKKLVSVALGLVTKPRALFLDEPTTGLDSTAAHFVVEHIKAVAETGVTVIMTIHQPSAEVFAMLDDIILLDPGGNLAFAGPIPRAIGYFDQAGYPTSADVNPADTFLNAVSNVPLTHQQPTWKDFYNVNPAKQLAAEMLEDSLAQSESAPEHLQQPSEFHRFTLLVQKLSLQYWRTPGAYFYRLIVITLFGFFCRVPLY
jgi:ABC-type multidrug transport system ATPase subunit